MRVAVVTVSLLFCLAAGGPAHAERQRPSLNWVRGTGAEQCPGAQTVAARLEELLGPLLVPPADANIAIEAGVTKSKNGFLGRALVTDARGGILGERTWVVGTDCRDVLEQVVLVIAVTLDPTYLERMSAVLQLDEVQDPEAELLQTIRDEGASTSKPAAAAASKTKTPPAAASSDSAPVVIATQAQTHTLASAELLLAEGAQPKTSVGLSASAFWQSDWWGLTLTVAGLLPTQTRATDSTGSASVTTVRVKPGACLQVVESRYVRIHGCLGVGLGLAFANGEDLSESHLRARLTSNAWGGIMLQLGARSLGALLRAGMEVHLQRLRVTYENGGSTDLLYQQSAIAGFAALGAYFDL